MKPYESSCIPKAQGSVGAICYHHTMLADGRIVSVFINLDTNLVVMDIVDANGKGGNEVYHKNV